MHRRTWICQECSLSFPTKDFVREHLEESHSGSWTDKQLPLLLEICERPIDETEIINCPMCPAALYLGKLLDHLAGHLEELSLFVLPRDMPGNDDSNESRNATGIVSDRVASSEQSIHDELSNTTWKSTELGHQVQVDQEHPFYAKVLQGYEPDPSNAHEISLSEDEIIAVGQNTDQGWWLAKKQNGDEGIVPKSHTVLLPEEPQETDILSQAQRGSLRSPDYASVGEGVSSHKTIPNDADRS